MTKLVTMLALLVLASGCALHVAQALVVPWHKDDAQPANWCSVYVIEDNGKRWMVAACDPEGVVVAKWPAAFEVLESTDNLR